MSCCSWCGLRARIWLRFECARSSIKLQLFSDVCVSWFGVHCTATGKLLVLMSDLLWINNVKIEETQLRTMQENLLENRKLFLSECAELREKLTSHSIAIKTFGFWVSFRTTYFYTLTLVKTERGNWILHRRPTKWVQFACFARHLMGAFHFIFFRKIKACPAVECVLCRCSLYRSRKSVTTLGNMIS